MNFDLQEYKKAQKVIKANNNILDEGEKKYYSRVEEIKGNYHKLKKELEEKEKAEIKNIRDKFETLKQNIGTFKKESEEKIMDYNLILKLMLINPELNKNHKVYEYDYINKNYEAGKQKILYNSIDSLIDTKYIFLDVYIVDNNKPKNRKSLIVTGNTIFNKEILNIPYDYGITTLIDYANVKTKIKDFPSEKLALQYYQKNKHKLLKDFLIEHKEIEQLYEEVIENTKSTEWQLEILEHQKNYYEKRYHKGTEKPEYKEIIKQINKLKGKVAV